MARITVEDCIDKFESRFELVLVASNRARKLYSGENPTIEKDNDKNTVIALREIADETIPIDEMKNNLVEEYQTLSSHNENEEELSLENNNSDNGSDELLYKEEISEKEKTILDSNNEQDILNEEEENIENNNNQEDNISENLKEDAD